MCDFRYVIVYKSTWALKMYIYMKEHCTKHVLCLSLIFKQDSDAPDKTSSSEEDEAEPSIKSRKKISQSRVCRKEDIRPLENEWVENQPKFLQNMTPNKMFRTLFRWHCNRAHSHRDIALCKGQRRSQLYNRPNRDESLCGNSLHFRI